jgi:hypothetical protein
MTYHPPPPAEPNGCLQTLLISRMIFGILAIPMLMILTVLIGVVFTFIAFSEHFLYGLGTVALCVGIITLLMRIESGRAARDHPPDL